MSLVLAIERDPAQTEILREVLRGRPGVDLVIVTSRTAAVAAMKRQVPDLILVTTLLSPRDEDALVAHLRSIPNASHLQTVTIPQLRRPGDADKKGSRFSFGKKKTAAPTGVDPEVFAEEVAGYLARAKEIREEASVLATIAAERPAASLEPEADPWHPYIPAMPEGAAEIPEPIEFPPGAPLTPAEELLAEAPHDPPPPPASVIGRDDFSAESEVDRIIRALGVDADQVQIADSTEEVFRIDLGAESAAPAVDAARVQAEAAARAQAEAEARLLAEIERVRAEAEAKLEAERQRARAEAEARARAEEEARLRAEAEARRRAEEEEARRRAEEEARRRAEEEARRKAEEEARRKAEEEARRKAEEEARRRAEEEARRRAEEEARRRAEEEARKRAEEEARKRAEAEARARAEAEAARARAEAEARRREEEARARAEAEARARAEAEARARAEEEARARAAAEARLAQELERVRAEAEQRRAEELAKLQAEAEAMRANALAQARAAAEAEAREALAAELARVRAEAETEIARAQGEAEQTFTQELLQVRTQAERALASELTRARADEEHARQAELARALEGEVARVRADADARLKAELDRVRREAEHARMADQAELDRIRREADERLALEVAALRADAERKREAELDAIRAEVDAMREAAAQQARSAAADAVAAELARSRNASPGISLPGLQEAPHERPAPSGDYYNLWQRPASASGTAPRPAARKTKKLPKLPTLPKIERHVIVRIAAVLIVMVGVAVSAETRWWTAVTNRVRTATLPRRTPAAQAAVEPRQPRDTGDLVVETNPPGARVILDGKPRGVSPLTLTDLKPGKHKLVIESSAGTIRRDIVIRAGEQAFADEAILPGFLAVNSRIPVDVMLGNRRVGSSEDGQLLLPPGRHKLTLRNVQFNYHDTMTVDIEAGRVRAHNVTLPIGHVNIDAPAGAEVWVEGQRIGEGPVQSVPVPIGTREVVVRHPDFGEHREFVEVRHKQATYVQPRGATGGPASPPKLLPLSRPKVKVGGR